MDSIWTNLKANASGYTTGEKQLHKIIDFIQATQGQTAGTMAYKKVLSEESNRYSKKFYMASCYYLADLQQRIH